MLTADQVWRIRSLASDLGQVLQVRMTEVRILYDAAKSDFVGYRDSYQELTFTEYERLIYWLNGWRRIAEAREDADQLSAQALTAIADAQLHFQRQDLAAACMYMKLAQLAGEYFCQLAKARQQPTMQEAAR